MGAKSVSIVTHDVLAKAFEEQGIRDGVQVNSVSPGAVMTGRRLALFEKWRLPTI